MKIYVNIKSKQNGSQKFMHVNCHDNVFLRGKNFCWAKIAYFFRILGHNILLFSSDLPYILLETSSTLSDSTKERIEGLFNQLTEEKYEIEATNVTSIKKADLETELDRSFVNQLIALGKFVLGTEYCVLVFKKSESFQFYASM